ncbi:MAG TPA: chromosome partitioning protein ParB [Lachnospiraceae bacterium]|nr:chromosome partitioning protein ParB [Lachnospiraceae bacterium]
MPGNVNEIEPDERVVEIAIERLREFRDHPFKVKADQQMLQLMESISQYGILSPLIVRPIPDGVYEIISGHRRKYAAQQLGYRKLPVIIRFLKDEDAVISMVDSNLQRELIRPSEKAFAYKMKYEAIRKKGRREDCGQTDHIFPRGRTIEIMGEESGESPKQMQRYLKISELTPELLEMLDDKVIAFNPAYEAAFLKEEEQKMLIQAMDYAQSSPSISQMQRMKTLSRQGKLTQDIMQSILSEVKKGEITRVIFKNEQLYQYFPKDYTPERMKREILEMLRQRIDLEYHNDSREDR